MTCREARKLIIPFIHDELSMEETRDFLQHVRGCKACMDELEIYYIVEAGLDKSDGEDIDYNLTAALNSHIREAYQKIFILFIGRVLKYYINTLMFFGVFIIAMMQLRIWFF